MPLSANSRQNFCPKNYEVEAHLETKHIKTYMLDRMLYPQVHSTAHDILRLVDLDLNISSKD